MSLVLLLVLALSSSMEGYGQSEKEMGREWSERSTESSKIKEEQGLFALSPSLSHGLIWY